MAPIHSKSILLPLLFITVLLIVFLSTAIVRDTITPTQPVADNETLVSAGGIFALGSANTSEEVAKKVSVQTIVVIVSLLSGTLLLSCFILFLWQKKKRRRGKKPHFLLPLLFITELLIVFLSTAIVRDTIPPTQPVADNKTLNLGQAIIYEEVAIKVSVQTIVVIVSLLSGTLLLSCFILFLWQKKKRKRGKKPHFLPLLFITDLLIVFLSTAIVRDTITPTQPVADYKTLALGSANISEEVEIKVSVQTIVVIVSLLILGTLLLLLSCFILFLWRKKKRQKKRRRVILGRTIFFSDKLDEDDRTKDLDLPLFNFGTIATATESFSAENKLGHGGFGPVYKGTLGGDKEIAVKRLAKSSQQGAEEFKNEVILIAKLQNRNIVRLLGCCIHGEERMLIYEYMPNKSLDAFIFAKEKAALLGWQTRYQIIIGITRGLLYLHHDSRYRIIHRDLKASNILLDKEMNPKISDFGMARLFGGDETDYNTRKIVGTYGYMSPEYAMEGIFSLKSDVYSFGVLLLEIISGRKNRGSYAFSQHLNLVAHAWSLWNEDKSLELVDEAMNNNFPSNDVLKCIKIGLLCVQNHSEDRPLMPFVLEMLGASVDITSLPHPKQPGFMDPLELDHISNNRDSCTLNELTVTLDGR